MGFAVRSAPRVDLDFEEGDNFETTGASAVSEILSLLALCSILDDLGAAFASGAALAEALERVMGAIHSLASELVDGAFSG